MRSTNSPTIIPHRKDEPPPLLCPHTHDPGGSYKPSELLSSGARGKNAVRTYFTHFMTIFECNPLVPGGESRATKSLKEHTTHIQGQEAPSAVQPHPTKPQLSFPQSHQLNITRPEPLRRVAPLFFCRTENPS